MNDALKILIIEDDAVIAQLLEHHMHNLGHHVIDICHNSEKASDRFHTLRPDLVLLDINIEGTRDGIELAEIIDEKYGYPYMFITALSDHSTLQRARAVNPVAYLVKPFKEEDLRASIMIGMSNYQREKTDVPLTLEDINKSTLSPLSDKEFEILKNLTSGLTNAQVAQTLDLSVNTVKWHSQNIYSKLGVKNRTAAAQFISDLK